MDNYDMINWLSKDISKNTIYFDEILRIKDDIYDYMKRHNLKCKVPENIFLVYWIGTTYTRRYEI